MTCIYHAIAMTKDGKESHLAGSFLSKEEAIKQIKESTEHQVWEFYYSFIALEKYRLESLGDPVIVRKEDREKTLWFEWIKSDIEDVGSYKECEAPEFSEHIMAWV